MIFANEHDKLTDYEVISSIVASMKKNKRIRVDEIITIESLASQCANDDVRTGLNNFVRNLVRDVTVDDIVALEKLASNLPRLPRVAGTSPGITLASDFDEPMSEFDGE